MVMKLKTEIRGASSQSSLAGTENNARIHYKTEKQQASRALFLKIKSCESQSSLALLFNEMNHKMVTA